VATGPQRTISLLGLRVEQTVGATDPKHADTSDRPARRALARPAAQDRIAARAEMVTSRAVLPALAAQALGIWVDVRADVDGAADRAEAERL
jgi:hypothetical protein